MALAKEPAFLQVQHPHLEAKALLKKREKWLTAKEAYLKFTEEELQMHL